MLILKRAWASPALCLVICACSEPPADPLEVPSETLPVGCLPMREERPASTSEAIELDAGVWCDGCPFDDQATLRSYGSYGVALHAAGNGKAALLANAQGAAGHAITLLDPSSGWSTPMTVPLGEWAAVAPGDGNPYILSRWDETLRLREPSGVEEDISCPIEIFAPAGIDVRDGEIQIVAGWFDEGVLHASLLARPIAEPESAWKQTFLGTFDQGPLQAARARDGEWIVVGLKGVDASLVRGTESVLVPVGAPASEEASPVPFDLVVGESFAAVVTQRPESLDVTLDDGRTIAFLTPTLLADPNCDGSTFCGGRCDFKQRFVREPSVFAAEGFLFIAFVETLADATILIEDVPCSEGSSDVCDCREVVERDESRSELVFARFDPRTLNGERAFAARIDLPGIPTTAAVAVEDRVVFALKTDADTEARLGSVPLSALVP